MPSSKLYPGHDIVVVGASAGGVEALSVLARGFPKDLPAAVFVIIHRTPHETSELPKILSRAGPLPAVEAKDREPIERGKIYLSPSHLQLLLEYEQVRTVEGPSEAQGRSAIDPLFSSAALVYGPRVIGVILSGSLHDGSAGLQDIKQVGGIAVVQDPYDASFDSMPRSALQAVKADFCLPVKDIPPLLARLVREPASAR